MSTIPPRLLHLIIYNPTLQPPESTHPDDEDAQEQAHVLFYTANDHAVSKDRVLRQVGLAKALTNFTTIFSQRASCESVHSQTRRMIMFTPEPDYWIYACFELERVPRASRKEEKGKAKQKEPQNDYNEASLHDAALQTQLLLGYEAFKVTHGSFASILNSMGKEALELQLERFFTVWAWNWDLGRQIFFSEYLGIRVHPLSTQLIPLIDVLEDKLPPHFYPVVLISSCLVSSRSASSQCPPALARQLLRILDARAAHSRQATTAGIGPAILQEGSEVPVTSMNEQKHIKNSNGLFSGVPGLNMNVNMDVRKWNWPGYLTFGMNGSPSNPKAQAGNTDEAAQEKKSRMGAETAGDSHKPNTSQFNPDAPVDSQALHDALTSEGGSQFPTDADNKEPRIIDVPSEVTNHAIPPELEALGSDAFPSSLYSAPIQRTQDNLFAETSASEYQLTSSMDNALPRLSSSPTFSELHVHLSDLDPLDTQGRTVRYLFMDNILFALIPTPERIDDTLDDAVSQDLADRSIELIDRLKEIVAVEEEKIASAFSSSPVQSVLQKSQYIITTPNELTYSSSAFSATSWHLHEGKRVLGLAPDLLEIYSRGQSPQDWHLAKRGLGTGLQGDVYMEIGRKEASLVDVDGEITGVLRRFAE